MLWGCMAGLFQINRIGQFYRVDFFEMGSNRSLKLLICVFFSCFEWGRRLGGRSFWLGSRLFCSEQELIVGIDFRDR
jgi:hypothetical protein